MASVIIGPCQKSLRYTHFFLPYGDFQSLLVDSGDTVVHRLI